MNDEKFKAQYEAFCFQCDGKNIPRPEIMDWIPVLDEDTNWTHADWDYVLHTNWAARYLAKVKPLRHVDIGSYSYFSTLCSAFVPRFEFYDVRPLGFDIPGLKCDSANLTDLHFENDSIKSLSCLHVLEHIGLGRYGDKLDAEGHIKAAKELARVLAPNGQLLIVLPMNEKPRINFNAHRILNFKQATELFAGLHLCEFTVLHQGKIIEQPEHLERLEDFTGLFLWTK